VEKSDFLSHVVSSKSVTKGQNSCLKKYNEIAKSRTSSFKNIDTQLDVKFVVTCVNKMAAARPLWMSPEIAMKN